jgi:hypothetical protein
VVVGGKVVAVAAADAVALKMGSRETIETLKQNFILFFPSLA